MNKVISIPLRTIAEITTGYHFRSGISDDPAGTVRVIQMGDTSPPNTVDWDGAARVAMGKNMEHDMLRDDDILFVMRGGNYYAIHTGTVGCQAIASPHFFRVRVLDKQRIMPTFLSWQLNQMPAQRYYSSVEAGTGQKSLRVTDLSELPVTLPPPARQHKIMQAVESLYNNNQFLQSCIANNESLLAAIAARELI